MIDQAIATIAEYNVMDWPIIPNYTAWNVIYGMNTSCFMRICFFDNPTSYIVGNHVDREKKEWLTMALIFQCGRYNQPLLKLRVRTIGI
jgi:hypothetical protein